MNHKQLKGTETFILSIYNFLNFFLNFKNNEIRVLIYHHIEKDELDNFKKQLLYLKKNWNFITPEQFENHVNGKTKLKGKNLLLTFDDGFSSNFEVARKILSKLYIKSIFFVPSEFVKIKSIKKARSFIKKNILDQNLPEDFNNIRNMTVKNLRYLIRNGHTIGAHSKTHVNLGNIGNKKKLKDEIIKSSKDLEKILKIKIKHFAFTYGNYKSMSQKSLKIAFQQYDYIYSSLRGSNYKNKKNEIIKRDAVYLDLGNKLLEIFINGIIDIKYFFQVLSINKIINQFSSKNKKI